MYSHSRLGRENGLNSPSPPSSPSFRHGRGKNSGGGGNFRGGTAVGGVSDAKLQNIVERLFYMVISAVYRRRAVLLFAPHLYISGMLLYMGTLGFDVVVISKVRGGGGKALPLGSMYRSPEVFEKLWPFTEAESNRSSDLALSCSF